MTGNQSAYEFSHARATLEFDAVLSLVANRCANESARALTRALEPGADPDVILASLGEIEEVRRYHKEHGDIPVGDTVCREDLVRVKERGDSVPPERLLGIAGAVRAADDARRLVAGVDEFPRLATIAAAIVSHPHVADAIEGAIDADGSIKDTASSALRTIRRDIHGLRGSLRSLSERLVADYGADSLATMLGSRYVVLVPRGKFRKSTGLVHSTSHTGESLYFEPFKLVERNNDLEARIADERAEEARILDELRALVAECAEEMLANLDVMDRLDCIRAGARFAEEFNCSTPAVSRGDIRLLASRHPVLERLLAESGAAQVPLDLVLDPGQRLMVITGPNAGGKTVALKTVGVSVLLFQCGLQVPCAVGSALPVFERVFVDIGDEQSMASSLSTFTSHLKNLDTMNRRADARTLCLIDEIGDGTDPDEGAALAIATLEKLLGSGAAVIATTHYGRIKTFALQTDGVSNASMAFEDDEARPLYRLLQGVAGRSRGLETARSAGFDAAVIERAESFVGADAFRLESVLSDLETSLRKLEAEREEVALRADELEREIAEYRSKAAEYDMTRKEAMRRAGREAEALLGSTRREMERLVKSIRESQADKESIRRSRETIEKLAERAHEARLAGEPRAKDRAGDVVPGDRVALNESGAPSGVVTDVDNGSATVEISGKRIKIRVDALYQAAAQRGPAEGGAGGVGYNFSIEPLTSTSLDVRGNDREDALAAVTRFVDQAVFTGVREVKIIHGIGTGVLANAINGLLRDDHRVTSMRSGAQAEGGVGVTIVSLSD